MGEDLQISTRNTMTKKLPTNAIVAVTLNCNSRCTMCNIWQNHITNELKPHEFLMLPDSLKDINITGGEPFLRMDLPEIVANIKLAAPKARLVLSTNGFLPKVIEKNIPKILQTDPDFAVRVSLDGWNETHDRIRRIPNGFNMIMETLSILKAAGVKDLGIGFTIMKANIKDLVRVFEFTRKEGLELSLTLVTSSAIYFGLGKESLRPDNHSEVIKQFNRVTVGRFQSHKPKEWFRGWFEQKLLEYYLTNHRPYTCDAGENFFYLDSRGNVYTCNVKGWLMGNLRQSPFKTIWSSKAASSMRKKVASCHDCWMVCTAKTNMKAHLLEIAGEVVGKKMRYTLWPEE